MNGWLVGAISALAGAVGYLYVNNQKNIRELQNDISNIINGKDKIINDIQNQRIEDLRNSNKDYVEMTQQFAKFMAQIEVIVGKKTDDLLKEVKQIVDKDGN